MTTGYKCDLCGEFYTEDFNYENLPQAGAKPLVSATGLGLPEITYDNVVGHVCVGCEEKFARTAQILGVEITIDAFAIAVWLPKKRDCKEEKE